MPIISDQEYTVLRDAANRWLIAMRFELDKKEYDRIKTVIDALDCQLAGTRRYKETKEIINIDGLISFLRADGQLISAKDWSVYEGTGLIIDNPNPKVAKEIIANVITPEKAAFIVKACRAYREGK